jgi:hypothetical protein
MTVHIGTNVGTCRECKNTKNDLYAGYCAQCRERYGRRSSHTEWAIEKQMERLDYNQKVKSGEIVERPAGTKSVKEREQLDATIGYIYLKRAVTDLMKELDKCGYSDSDITEHYKSYGDLSEPYASIVRVKKLLEKE